MAVEKLFIPEQRTLSIKLSGDIDHHQAAGYREQLDALLDEYMPSKVVIDLSAVDFMDSSGLGLVLGRYRIQQERGGTLEVKNPAPRIKQILSMAGVDRYVKITG